MILEGYTPSPGFLDFYRRQELEIERRKREALEYEQFFNFWVIANTKSCANPEQVAFEVYKLTKDSFLQNRDEEGK